MLKTIVYFNNKNTLSHLPLQSKDGFSIAEQTLRKESNLEDENKMQSNMKPFD